MEALLDELKSRWSSTIFIPSSLGTTIFIPSPQTPTLLLLRISLTPPPPPPALSLSSFLASSSVLPSTSSSICSSFGPQQQKQPLSLCTALCLLYRRPATLLVFFPTGDNSDRVGFVAFSLKNSNLSHQDGAEVRVSKHTMHSQRVFKILVSPFSGTSKIGHLIACTTYGVQWHSLDFASKEDRMLGFLGSKSFKTSAVVDACWSPHVPQQSLVLLENGKLFLFDLDTTQLFSRKCLTVPWSTLLGEGGWLGCEFSWHPQILVVAHSFAVFLLDFRAGDCVLTCLLKINTATKCTPAIKDRFLALSKAGLGHYHFAVASECRVVLFDVRKSLVPLLQWEHGITGLSCLNVFPLSESENCILVGSFWHGEFDLFCYGRPQATENSTSESNNSLCALDIPSALSVSGRKCGNGSCLLREAFYSGGRNEIVLGFDILDKDLHSKLSEQGGFTLIRLMSSGKLELQQYIPSQDFVKGPLQKPNYGFEDSLLFMDSELEYKFPKRFKYLKLDYLNAYMKDDLDKALYEKVNKRPHKAPYRSGYVSGVDFHRYICDKFKTRNLNRSYGVVRSMSSIHEVSLSKIWAHFPADLLRMAFSYNSQLREILVDKKKVSLEFLEIPNQTQDPPFSFREPSCRSSKLPQKVCPGTTIVGPVLPTPVLLTINGLREEQTIGFSANSEIKNQCDRVLKAASEVSTSVCGDDTISLHKYVPTRSECRGFCDEKFTTFICKPFEEKASRTGADEMDGLEMFDHLSPIELKFDSALKLGTNPYLLQLPKRHYSKFLQKYDPHQQYLKNSNLHKH